MHHLKHDVVIIGAGIIGAATAWQLSRQNPRLSIAVLEKEPGAAHHQSGTNSGVIHSGIYYKPGSLKALNCRQGYQELLDFCQQHNIRHEICGKLIAAVTPEEASRLPALLQNGQANGLEGLRLLGAEEAHEREPHLQCLSAIQVPQTGIVDYREVTEKLLQLSLEAGTKIHYSTRVTGLICRPEETFVQTTSGEWRCRLAINCAGLYTDKLAAMTGHDDGLMVLPFRGEYYELTPERRYLVRHLIYPVPNPAFPFLGVHFTRMTDGRIEAGPNAVLAFRREGYRLHDIHLGEMLEMLAFPGLRCIARKYWRIELEELRRSFSKKFFVKALQRLIPEVRPQDLLPHPAGVRAMACKPNGELVDDFYIKQDAGVIHVLNAPSPAATASLAIGRHIASLVNF